MNIKKQQKQQINLLSEMDAEKLQQARLSF